MTGHLSKPDPDSRHAPGASQDRAGQRPRHASGKRSRSFRCAAPPRDGHGAFARFRRALQNNLTAFGKHAFRKHRSQDQSRSIINASLFDVMARTLSTVPEALVSERAEVLRQAFYKRMRDWNFIRSITNGPNGSKQVRTRFEIAENMMTEVFGAH